MKRLNALIQIEGILSLNFVANIEITSSRNEFTDTCLITLPQKVYRQGRKLSDYIRQGAAIQVYFGYFPNRRLEFSGYVKSFDPQHTLTIECEDMAYIYKTRSIGNDIRLTDTTFRELIAAIYDGDFLTTDDKIGTWSISRNATVLDVLDELKSKFNTISCWQDGILYVNYEFEKEPEKTILVDVNRNVPSGTDNISRSTGFDADVVSYGVSPQKNGTTIETFAYYADELQEEIVNTTQRPARGTLNKFEIPNVTLEQLQQLTQRRLPNIYVPVISGDVTTYGEPTIKHGDRVRYLNKNNLDVQGIYKIASVTKTYGVGEGIRQKIEIGAKLANI